MPFIHVDHAKEFLKLGCSSNSFFTDLKMSLGNSASHIKYVWIIYLSLRRPTESYYTFLESIFYTEKYFASQKVFQRILEALLYTVRAPIKRALQLKTPPHKKMLTFCFYIIFELKFHQKRGIKIIQGARCIGTRTVLT